MGVERRQRGGTTKDIRVRDLLQKSVINVLTWAEVIFVLPLAEGSRKILTGLSREWSQPQSREKC